MWKYTASLPTEIHSQARAGAALRAQRLYPPAGLVGVAQRGRGLVLKDRLGKRFEQRHEARRAVGQRPGGDRQSLIAEPRRNPAHRPQARMALVEHARPDAGAVGRVGETAAAPAAPRPPPATRRSRRCGASAPGGSRADVPSPRSRPAPTAPRRPPRRASRSRRTCGPPRAGGAPSTRSSSPGRAVRP